MDNISNLIIDYRKANSITQKDFAEMLGVTDKAVSKWERSKSFPDIDLIPKIAEVLSISTDRLLDSKERGVNMISSKSEKLNKQINLTLCAISIAMGVTLTILSILNAIDTKTGFIFAGIGIFSMSLKSLRNIEKKK